MDECNTKVTLSFPRGGESGKRCAIRITDDRSSAGLEVELSMEAFGDMMSGMGHVPAKLTSRHFIEKWGMQIDRKSVVIPSPNKEQEQALIRGNTPEGYIFLHRSYTNHCTLDIVYVKWAEAEAPG